MTHRFGPYGRQRRHHQGEGDGAWCSRPGSRAQAASRRTCADWLRGLRRLGLQARRRDRAGDAHARMAVRLREVYQSIDLIRKALAKLPKGEIITRAKGNPEGRTIERWSSLAERCSIILPATARAIWSGCAFGRQPSPTCLPDGDTAGIANWRTCPCWCYRSILASAARNSRGRGTTMPLEMLKNVLSNILSRPATRRYPYRNASRSPTRAGKSVRYDAVRLLRGLSRGVVHRRRSRQPAGKDNHL